MAHALPPSDLLVVHEDVREALSSGRGVVARVHGKDVTPRLLEHFHDNSGGESLRANIELVLSNAGLAGQVAAHVAEAGTTEASA